MVQRPYYRKCLFCNCPFNTFEEDKVFCNDKCETKYGAIKLSESCKNRGPREVDIEDKHTKICANCKRFFSCPPGHWTHRKKLKFCSDECYIAHYYTKNIIRDKKPCRECGREFIPSQEESIFCSESCRKSLAMYTKIKKAEKRCKESNGRDKKKRNGLPFEVINRIVEVKRLKEDWTSLVKWRGR